MRNLKKFLALVLAMMMTLSLMVTVNAAAASDFTDKDSITENFAEGIEVLKGMGVFEGYPDGSFGPKGEITRAETAAIVYRLATGDWEGTQAHLYKDYQQFDDVASSQWFAGYINYCANAEWIAGYGNGKFGPNDKVTAYQAAAMILRAVGYGKNGEFVGSTWRTQVANVTRSEGLLVNVDKTTYANTMNNFATRELVAEILFQAAQIPTVTWTMLGGYNKYQSSITVAGQDNLLNPSLGYINYGLTNHQGIVLGNQATGEKATKIGFGINQLVAATDPQVMNNSGSYTYTDTAATTAAGNVTMAFDAETGLDLFGHKVKVWYNANGGTHKTYAVFDKAVLSATITASDAEKIGKTQLDADAGANKLSAAVNAAGFTVPVTDQQFYASASFSRFGALADTAPTATTAEVYVVISNNSDKTVDVVIPVNVAAAQITKVDNWSATKTINLDSSITADDTDTQYEQADVTSPSEGFVVGSKVIATEITQNTKDDSGCLVLLGLLAGSGRGLVLLGFLAGGGGGLITLGLVLVLAGSKEFTGDGGVGVLLHRLAVGDGLLHGHLVDVGGDVLLLRQLAGPAAAVAGQKLVLAIAPLTQDDSLLNAAALNAQYHAAQRLVLGLRVKHIRQVMDFGQRDHLGLHLGRGFAVFICHLESSC